MWRFRKSSRIPIANIAENNLSIRGREYNRRYDTDVRWTEANYIPFASEDKATHEEKLADIYDDIKKNGFDYFLYAEEIDKILNEFPEFDVTISSNIGETLLDRSIYKSTSGIANKLINSPNMTIESLTHSLDYFNKINNPNTRQKSIKTMIESKLKEKLNDLPSAPPLQEENFEPSAPPLQEEDFVPSAPQMMTSFQIRNLDTGEVGDIRNFPNSFLQQPLNLPNNLSINRNSKY